jgi:hypothetical protein
VSTRFERIKKEPHWDLSINKHPGDGNGNTPVKTPRKRGPSKNTPQSKGAAHNGGSDDDEGSEFGTPSKKKGVLNKVKGGRVMKAKGKGANASQSFGDESMDDIKPEVAASFEMAQYENSPGNGYSNGSSWAYEGGGEQYYDPSNDDEV